MKPTSIRKSLTPQASVRRSGASWATANWAQTWCKLHIFAFWHEAYLPMGQQLPADGVSVAAS